MEALLLCLPQGDLSRDDDVNAEPIYTKVLYRPYVYIYYIYIYMYVYIDIDI
jgi:hypothetical protein